MIDLDGQALVDEVPRFVGAPGVNPALNQLYIDAGVQLDNEAVPANDMVRFAMLNPQQSGGILGTQATQFNPSKDVSEQNRTGNMGMAWGFNFGKSQNIAQHTAGEFGTSAGQPPGRWTKSPRARRRCTSTSWRTRTAGGARATSSRSPEPAP